MYFSEYKIRVRYSDTDQMGYVYYGNYASFYEIGRVEALRELGFSYKTMEDDGIIMPVLDCYSKFLLPAKYDELITIKTSIKELPRVKIQFSYEIINEKEQLLNIGETTLVFLRKESHRPCRAPEKVIQLLKPFFE
ncbi:MAG: acyl-CoA thioesterase [Flammeovirgaceae bacterium]|nr:acyl-CoA thioesterase [Flammeovirgaceae bacterium]